LVSKKPKETIFVLLVNKIIIIFIKLFLVYKFKIIYCNEDLV